MLSRPRIAAFLAAALAATAAARAGLAAPAKPPAPIGPDAVWTPPAGFRDRVNAACGNAGAKFPDCFAAQMKKAGASKAALDFTRRTGNLGYLSTFVETGRVDIAYAEYPFRANENSLLFLVNGEPPMIDVDDPATSRFDAAKLESSAAYVALKKKYPKLAVFPASRKPPRGAQQSAMSNGGQRFFVSYELHDGCHACRNVGIARVAFEFDEHGQLTRARILQLRAFGSR